MEIHLILKKKAKLNFENKLSFVSMYKSRRDKTEIHSNHLGILKPRTIFVWTSYQAYVF